MKSGVVKLKTTNLSSVDEDYGTRVGERMPRRDAFPNASYAQAKMGMCDTDFTPAGGIQDDSRLILTAPVKKLSRNHEGTTQFQHIRIRMILY
ncbi:hypothetical protein OROGR_009879 [Orobanche gracilis]